VKKYPERFEGIWAKRTKSDFASRKEAAFHMYQLMERDYVDIKVSVYDDFMNRHLDVVEGILRLVKPTGTRVGGLGEGEELKDE